MKKSLKIVGCSVLGVVVLILALIIYALCGGNATVEQRHLLTDALIIRPVLIEPMVIGLVGRDDPSWQRLTFATNFDLGNVVVEIHSDPPGSERKIVAHYRDETSARVVFPYVDSFHPSELRISKDRTKLFVVASGSSFFAPYDNPTKFLYIYDLRHRKLLDRAVLERQ